MKTAKWKTTAALIAKQRRQANFETKLLRVSIDDVVFYYQDSAEDKEKHTRYARRMRAGGAFPPATAFVSAGRYVVADGNHRVLAAESIGVRTIPLLVQIE